MRHRGPHLHAMHIGTKRIEADRTSEALDGFLWFAAPYSQESAEIPPRSKVRIERQGTVQQRDATVKIAHQMRQGVSAPSQRHGIVLAELYGAVRKAGSFRDFRLGVGQPATQLAPGIAPRSHGISRCEVGITRDRLAGTWLRRSD